jgi:hypothetical protein
MHLILDLDKGRFGMRSPPFFDITQNLLALFNPALFVHCFFHALFCIQDGRIVSAFGSPGYPSALQKFRGHPCMKDKNFESKNEIVSLVKILYSQLTGSKSLRLKRLLAQ